MESNLLSQLAEMEVPPPPAGFDEQLHLRVNRSLVAWQFVDLLIRGLPWALGQFGKGVLGIVIFTLTGRYEPRK